MLDFMEVSVRFTKNGVEVYPTFIVKKSKDLIIRGKDFYAIYDESTHLWDKNEDTALALIDKELDIYLKEHPEYTGASKLYIRNGDNCMIDKWHKYCQKQMRDNYHELDSSLIFMDQEIKREDYATKKLPYNIEEGECPAWDELVGTLYSDSERHKIEWCIGCIVSGDSVDIQKFAVFYGSAGTGKSTVLNIITKLFEGYVNTFDAKSLGTSANVFALEPFKDNPLVAIQHDGDLSRIDDNTRLNSIVSHESMLMNEKFKAQYSIRFNSFLLMGTNQPVKITDSKSGLMRRLIDISPTGNKVSVKRYNELMRKIDFELGTIAWNCLKVYESDPRYYDAYVPTTMIGETNSLYDFVLDNSDIFERDNSTTLSNAWNMYKQYVEDSMLNFKLDRMKFKAELKDYFNTFEENHNGLKNYYEGFLKEKFKYIPSLPKRVEAKADWLQMGLYDSFFDAACAGCYAQYAKQDGTPAQAWDDVIDILSRIDTKELHYVRVPLNHIVIDFDIPDSKGEKCLNKNLQAAAKFPPTYAELSKSGKGVHLHYIYKGDPKKLSRIYDDHIEIKVFTGKSSLRRKLSACNKYEITEISSGLPLKGDDKVISEKILMDEKTLRKRILRNLNKEYWSNTAPSIDFIFKLLEEAYESGIPYDVSDLKQDITNFALNSTHQADKCLKLVAKMKFHSEAPSNAIDIYKEDSKIVLYDVESFPNMFLVCYSPLDADEVYSVLNPSPIDIQKLCEDKLVGFNNLKYDNHMLYGCRLGLDAEGNNILSQRLINEKNFSGYREAKSISYTDIFDYAAVKQSLKKWEIQLGIKHNELGLRWDEPVPEELFDKVIEYCKDDVRATKAVWYATQGDFAAREILAELTSMTVNDTTNQLTTVLIFEKDKRPQSKFNYRFMGECHDDDTFVEGYDEYTRFDNKGRPVFYGYSFDPSRKECKSQYRDIEDVGEGGHVWAAPGMYWNVWTFDVASMHPSTIIAEELFGPYTARYKALRDARVCIKHKDYQGAIDIFKSVFNKDVSMYLEDKDKAKALSQALKIALNSVYGLTAASFDHPFKDPRNIDNIVAKRGALFMVNLRHIIEEMGGTVIHIKTDSIKVVNPSIDIQNKIVEYGKMYGYDFEIEHIFEKICLVNNAVYVAKLAENDPEEPGKWTATGAQFAVPYVFKSLFSHEPLIFDDKCETKSVKSSMYLDYNEDLPNGEHNRKFVGKVGLFTPIKPGCGGAELVRENGEKFDAVTGTKGYRWLEAETVMELNKYDDIDISYYQKMVDTAVETISQFDDIEKFLD